MFSDCEGKAISFYKKGKENETKTQSVQTENKKKKYVEKEIQVVERTDSFSQTNVKEIMTRLNKNYDEKKLEIFLKSVHSIYNTNIRRLIT
jgi:hypothetical protein